MTDAHSDADCDTQWTLNPAVRVLWRAAHTVQLELGEHAVVLDGVGSADIRQLTGAPAQHPADSPSDSLDDALTVLGSGGFLVRRHGADPPPSPRLAADLAALRVRHGMHAGHLLAARHEAAVTVEGTARAAPLVAALLGAAGVGRVTVTGPGDVRLAQAAPGGLAPADEGHRYVRAAGRAVRRAAPECDTSPLPPGAVPDLTVLVLDGPADSDVRARLHVRDCTHLAVQVDADRGVVGPLVVPGLTSCLHCADLHRLDRDLAWPLLAVQLAGRPRPGPPSDVSLTGLTASLAALQALAYLDGDPVASVAGTLEVRLPDWRVRRRSFPAHPECECGAYGAARPAATAAPEACPAE